MHPLATRRHFLVTSAGIPGLPGCAAAVRRPEVARPLPCLPPIIVDRLRMIGAVAGPYAYTGSAGYMFPRPDGIILGGTFELDQWSTEPEPAAIDKIIALHKQLFGGFRCA